MKKYFNFTLLALATLLFTGCSNEEDVTGAGKADPAGTIGFSFPMPKEAVTYAGTDANGNVAIANANESIIKGVSIFMFETGGSKLLKSVQTFTGDQLTLNGGKAIFELGTATGANTFYAVANADFHVPAASLTALVVGTSTLADFQKIISNNTGSTPLVATADKGLLMTGYREVTDVLAPLSTEKVINLKRRVARFDIQNQQYNIGTDTLGTNFQITAVYVSKANYAGYLTAEASTGATLPTPDKIDAIPYTGTNDGVLNKSVFYLWPTVLDAAHTQTTISVEGVLNGVTQVYIVKPTANVDITGNHRYTLTVKKAPASKNISLSIAVDEWDEGTTVAGEIDQTAGTTFSALSNPTAGAGGVFLPTMDGTTVNYDASAATGTAVLTLTSKSFRAGGSGYIVNTYNGTESGGTNITVTKNQTVTYSGAEYTTVYTITVPVQTLPVDKKVVIAEVANPSNKKEIIIKANPNYASTTLKPVLVGGKYWAPVNVGATTDVATTLNQASMGSLYQWGRSYGSVYGTMTDTITGPLTLAAANLPANASKFIKTPVDPFNWLEVDGIITTQDQADALWSGANAQAVCPTGWRLPTSDELTIIKNKHAGATVAANRLAIAGDGGVGTLYLPVAGQRFYAGGTSYQGSGSYGHYWSSSADGIYVKYLNFYGNICENSAQVRGYGFSVRCVQK